MANYPTADPSFGTKTNGQTIDASHVNGLQDEVVAIGAALRGTLQHAITVNGALGVAGASTFAGSAAFSSLVTATGQPRALVYSTAAQALADGSFTAITFESEDHDVGGLHSTGTNPSRLTIPAGSSGLYLCGGTVRFSTGGVGNPAQVRLLKGGATEISAGSAAMLSSVAQMTLSVSAPVVLDGAEYIEIQAQPSGSTGSTPSVSQRRSASELWAVRLW